MLIYTLRRVAIMIPIIFLVSVVVFFLANLMPGDALTGKIDPLNTDPAYIEEMREKLGYNDPTYVQYLNWVSGFFQGDFGQSFVHKMPASELILSRLPNTILLAVVAMIITYIVSFLMGRYAGRHPYTLGDYGVQVLNYLALAMPSFVAALLLIYFVSFQLGWLPATGSIGSGVDPGTWKYIVSKVEHAILPSLCLGLLPIASYTQFLRNDMIESSQKDFVRMARAKGTPEKKVYNKHILRNSVIPIVTLLGFDLAGIIGGSVIIETIFTYPGVGQLFVDSINNRDYTVVMAITMLLTVMTLIGNLLADIFYALVDPRIRLD
ncbi:ABC transporter permease [Virgibacillus pantothenticus]|uniref:Peptide ABC transporter permease n=1 Tax=Virgibacillus pantothenticus TaxID=1473 RepID=A0A0L0QRB6_VIRPA|nr:MULTISPECIES: oligopeptide ABC transporter permease [Virgibacillus]API92268.1 peptide ABC transporter permease [Virgibacillus sp. 6R]KNE21122.1 peptide ABC transporter permease [Virgibacillus pantothenticus]MBS7427133.1 ABC transporter permease [Virgibacillus sp. 19R1-5]MBU8567512.1 ABC transporter permease [Virgibacillus pantothenticus]MBU8601126.1 ABC transporter permease [Virgibacillus pantothenticus]